MLLIHMNDIILLNSFHLFLHSFLMIMLNDLMLVNNIYNLSMLNLNDDGLLLNKISFFHVYVPGFLIMQVHAYEVLVVIIN